MTTVQRTVSAFSLVLWKVGDNPPPGKPKGIFYWIFCIFWLLLFVWIFDVILHRLYDWLCC